jgi:hypothetical protein
MAKLTRSNSLSALVEGGPSFRVGTGRFSIGLNNVRPNSFIKGTQQFAHSRRPLRSIIVVKSAELPTDDSCHGECSGWP